jgi:hypothetical protein
MALLCGIYQSSVTVGIVKCSRVQYIGHGTSMRKMDLYRIMVGYLLKSGHFEDQEEVGK